MMDLDRVLNYALMLIIVAFVAVLTYFVMGKVYVVHHGDAYVYWYFAPGIIMWPPYFDLIHANQLFSYFTNYSLGYGDPGAPVRILVIYNPLTNFAANFILNYSDYILRTSGEGLVRYDIVFNLQSFSSLSNPNVQSSTLLVGSTAYCIYGINKSLVFDFLAEVSREVRSNATAALVRLSNESFIINLTRSLGLNINVTQCLSRYGGVINSYQLSIPLILSSLYIPSTITPGSLTTYQPFLVIIGYSERYGVLVSDVNDVDLEVLVNNLLTQGFLYGKSSIVN